VLLLLCSALCLYLSCSGASPSGWHCYDRGSVLASPDDVSQTNSGSWPLQTSRVHHLHLQDYLEITKQKLSAGRLTLFSTESTLAPTSELLDHSLPTTRFPSSFALCAETLVRRAPKPADSSTLEAFLAAVSQEEQKSERSAKTKASMLSAAMFVDPAKIKGLGDEEEEQEEEGWEEEEPDGSEEDDHD
jgi:hypothetical protein